MNSANRVTTNRIRNRYSATSPRRLARKLATRRAVIGRTRMPSTRGCAKSSTPDNAASDIPGLEIDPWVDQRVGHVLHQLHHQPEQGEDVERGEHHGIVALDRGLVAEIAEAVEREDHLDEQGAGEQDADEGAGEAGDDDQHGVAEDVAV